MSNWNLSAQEAAAAVDGKLEVLGGGGLSDTMFKGVGTDTRAALTNQLFIALKGDAHDAHDYLIQAIEKGASGLLIHRELAEGERSKFEAKAAERGMGFAVITVKDTLLALQALGRHWRHKCRAMVLGITGSNGKTSTKEFATALLSSRMRVMAAKGSFNNHWGVPFTLLSIDPEHDVAVIEMGMNHPGELKLLSKLVDANAVVCTMVGRGHLEGVGSIEGAAAAKAEIYEFAPANATFIFNLDNPYTAKMMAFADERRRVLTFSETQESDVRLRAVSMTPQALTIEGSIRGVAGKATVPVYGRHNTTNLMAAACLALVAGLTPAEIWAALPLCRAAWGRNQWVALASGAKCLFDGYNANPESMGAALENAKLMFHGAPFAGRKYAVLAEMRELGEQTEALHAELGERTAGTGFDEVVFIGPSAAAFRRGFAAVNTKTQLLATTEVQAPTIKALAAKLAAGDFVLIKGSRGMSLEKVLQELAPLDFGDKKKS